MKHLKALNKYFWKYRFRFSIGIVFIIISNYFGVLSPQVTGFVVDYVQQFLSGKPFDSGGKKYDVLVNLFVDKVSGTSYSVGKIVALCGITILVLALLRGFFMFLMRQTIIVMSRHIEFDQKNEVYSHYQKLDTAFYKTHSTGDLMNRIAEDVSRVRMFTGPAIMYLVNLATLISLSVFYMFKRDYMLTIYVLAPLPLLAVTIYYVNTIIHRKSERIQALLSDLTTNAQESYSGIRVIKSFIQEKAMFRFFEKNSEEYRQNAIGLAKMEAIYFPSMTLIIGISTLVTILIGGIYYINDPSANSLATLVEFIVYINMLMFPVSAIGWTASMIQRASASQKRLNEFLKTEPEIHNSAKPEKIEIDGNIEFDHVDFVYPHTGIRALHDFTLNIRKGQKIAIVGRTGSGKTTVAQLLLRMYDTTGGVIRIDGKDIKELDLQNLRHQVSYVPQDVFLFSDTVENNIRFGLKDKADASVVQAAKYASVHNEIESFSAKYNTMIGERGVTLSGGQKQRVSIARALIKDPGFVIFDDCLSAVDAKTEREITASLYEYLQDKTAIIITHRIFSLFNFDKIVVLEDGEIVESGTHTDLLALNGYYTDLYTRQQEQENTNGN